ncbi:hypothetical protein [Parvibaculum sp.]|uniref:hypothetical protein n=1 Tax=Parvibaculum sp. TaxID=2024848 RepID=UPI0032973A2E
MLDDYGLKILQAVQKMPLETLKPKVMRASEKLMREVFNEDVRTANYDIPESMRASVRRSIEDTKFGRRSDPEPEPTKEDYLRTLRNDTITLWGDATHPEVDDELQLIEGVGAIWDDLVDVGYSEEDVMRFLSYFLEE